MTDWKDSFLGHENEKSKIMKKLYLLLASSLVTIIIFSLYLNSQEKKEIDFNTEIKPILNKNCISCHGGVKKSGGFSLLFEYEALDTTKSGKYAIVPGKAHESEMIKRILHQDPKERMPPESDPLDKEQIKLLTEWINQGAKWGTHWAYEPPKIIPPSSSNNALSASLDFMKSDDWSVNQIDEYIKVRLDHEQLKPAKQADKEVLIRRLYIGLTGLPPTLEEIDLFLNDNSENAYENLVDRVLENPHFGEKWAAIWLDLARYADTKGYRPDTYRSMWMFRDWVIRAFNEDKPFNEFTIEQLAGDLLQNPNQEQLIASAYHRNTMTNDEGGSDDEEFRVAAVIDRVSNTWEVWQGTTMACVQCHSHPYDPFKHEDFYKSYAIFNNTEDKDRGDDRPYLSFYAKSDQDKLDEITSWIKTFPKAPQFEKNATIKKKIKQSLFPYLRAGLANEVKGGRIEPNNEIVELRDGGFFRFDQIDLSSINSIEIGYTAEVECNIELRKDDPKGELIARATIKPTGELDRNWNILKLIPKKQVKTKSLYFLIKKSGERGHRLLNVKDLYFYGSKEKKRPWQREKSWEEKADILAGINQARIPIMKELPKDQHRPSYLFTRGNWLTPGDTIIAGIPGSMKEFNEMQPSDRLELAEWLVSPQNPLTSRVMVNRVWEQLFGKGLVETSEDFGTQGNSPSHPELLDYLALKYMHEYQWSTKKLIKEMVMSATFRQASVTNSEKLKKDPYNHLISRGPRFRLSAEEIRDQALFVGGLLNEEIYGPSVMPAQPDHFWKVPLRPHIKWRESTNREKFRRGLYTYWRRSTPYPSMTIFDSPSRQVCTTRRIRTNIPTQALVTLNDTVYVEAAQGFASRMRKEGGKELDAQIKYALKVALARDPRKNEVPELENLYKDALAHYQEQQTKTWKNVVGDFADPTAENAARVMLASAILNLDEIIMRN
ncbi:DUF1553 domain-containing protein [Flexithrix dorotheae]|uniref:DUF1553 domain-containing protein n=1 Tax=Flexithrix dorotheae TaxID=70993 RepID=UPI0003677A31|nr:DUF1553 domain-containing protein [Flexithrix dorotheae]